MVGIDSHNIDDTHVRARPVHTRLLGAEIPICEHMRGLGRLPDSGFRFSAVPPKVAGMGTFPVRAYARDRRLKPVGDDRAGEFVEAAVLDGEAELGIGDAGARAGCVGLDDDQPAVDLGPPVHPRGILLADEAALGETDAVEFGGIAFEPEDVAELGAAFGDAEAEAMLEPAGRGIRGGREPATAEFGQARIGTPSPPSSDQCTASEGSRSMRIGRRRR